MHIGPNTPAHRVDGSGISPYRGVTSSLDKPVHLPHKVEYLEIEIVGFDLEGGAGVASCHASSSSRKKRDDVVRVAINGDRAPRLCLSVHTVKIVCRVPDYPDIIIQKANSLIALLA